MISNLSSSCSESLAPIVAPDVESAIANILTALRYTDLCTGALGDSNGDQREDVRRTLGLDVVSCLSEALEALGRPRFPEPHAQPEELS